MGTGDFQELGLMWSFNQNGREVEICPGGSSKSVTKENVKRYICELAHLRLNRQIRKQSRAFCDGMGSVMDLNWIRMFSADELQILISGAPELDTLDLRAN